MDIKKYSSKITQYMYKYRYAVLVLIIGLALMLLPDRVKDNEPEQTQHIAVDALQYNDITKELKQVLSQIDGVGQVEVMLTISTGQQNFYQQDEDQSTSESGSTIRKETVIITSTDRQQEALLLYTKAPEYLGAIIVCKGAQEPTVKLAIIDAVSKITGLNSNQISVVKMK